MSIEWPYQITPYLSALPGVAGPGLDISKGDKPSKLYFITSLSPDKFGGPAPDLGPNCFAGTARWCWQIDQGEGYHKYIIPVVSGYVYLGRATSTTYGRGDTDYIGHAAPGAGLFYQTANVRLLGGSNCRIWHLPSWMGDLPSADGPDKFKADQRDCLQFSMDGYYPTDCAHINCEGRFAMDEAVQVYYAMNGISWIRGAIYDPLHVPPAFEMAAGSHHAKGEDHGFGHIIGGSDVVDNSLVLQSVYAHTTDRNPLTGAVNHAHVNVLHYDHGRMNGGKGAGLHVSDWSGHSASAGRAMSCNMVGSVSVRGPNNNEELCLAGVSGSLPPGSAAHAAHNGCIGWPSPASQDDFFDPKPDGYMARTLRPSAWPVGFGSNYEGVLRPFRDPLNPTTQEALAFSSLMRRTAGCMPARRYLYEGGLNKTFDRIDAAIRGVPSTRQWVNTVAEAGGWPKIPTLGPESASAWHHAPLPTGEDRDEIMPSGRTRIREWVIGQYNSVIGR
jgi:hypothetical protein